jgi:hypothetical protein
MRKEGGKEKKEGKLSQRRRQKGRDRKRGRGKKQRLLWVTQGENYEKKET